MGAPRKADWREERRKRAWALKEQGWRQKDIAEALGGSEGAVSQWLKRGRAGGVEALNAHPPKGVPARLLGGMGAPRKADWREERRKRAWALKEQGWRQKDIAEALGGSEGAATADRASNAAG